MSRERAAREVVEGIIKGFENVDSNQVRSALEASDSVKEVNAALGAFGEYLNEVIDPEIVMDFSTFQSALTPDAPARFHGPEGCGRCGFFGSVPGRTTSPTPRPSNSTTSRCWSRPIRR
jgi:hypothetical protein